MTYSPHRGVSIGCKHLAVKLVDPITFRASCPLTDLIHKISSAFFSENSLIKANVRRVGAGRKNATEEEELCRAAMRNQSDLQKHCFLMGEFSGQSNKVLELERTGAALCFYDKTISLHVLSAESCSSTGSGISICSLCRFGQRDFKLQEPLKAKVVCFSKSFHDCRIVEDTLLLSIIHTSV